MNIQKKEEIEIEIEKEKLGFASRSIHLGKDYRGTSGAINAPIYLSSTFEWNNQAGFDYTRSGNPNFTNLEEVLADLESAKFATVFSSGVSAITAVACHLKSGDVVIAEENIYGCTYRLFEQVFRKFGVTIEYYDLSNPRNFNEIVEKRPALVWIESPTNPLLKIIDIETLSKWTRFAGSALVVDNTFSSPAIQKPIELGADISLSSTTKYINGHSDCLGGVVCTNSEEWQEKLIFSQKALGLNPGAFDSWLTLRGLKTLAIRTKQHSENALNFAKYFEGHPLVNYVRYPLLPSHPQYHIAKKQMISGSGIVTIEFDLSETQIRKLLENFKIFTVAESLGGVESLVCYPTLMSHASVPEETKDKLGITKSLLRFSIGIEEAEDLIYDLEIALAEL